MLQVLVRGGRVHVEEVAPPSARPNGALVRIHNSVISSGTESGFVSDGSTVSFVVKKARDPLNVEKLKRKIASVGVRGAIDVVRNKIFEFQSPGYSSAGTIIECGPKLEGFRVGDRVACAGVGYAYHAQFNAVPQQLLTPIPDGVAFEEAAFVSLGAIAMQGVRQLMPTFGETFAVVGLGLLGQIALQIIRAAGCRAICSDPVESRRAMAINLGADAACAPGDLHSVVNEWSGGYGADGVLICAASQGSDVTNSALDLCRQKGRVAVVGAVGMQLVREPLYMKELDFRLSCSYGPGRYNSAYEEQGLDYPIGYVRWTEGRNMAEFLRMIAEKKVQVQPLVSVRKPIENAHEAYAAILDKDSGAISAVLSYQPELSAAQPLQRRLTLRNVAQVTGKIAVGVIGAGGFATTFHIPNLGKIDAAKLVAVCDNKGSRAKQVAQQHGAQFCTTDYREVVEDPKVHAVIVATRHDMHKPIVLDALAAGKHVLVEKPMAIHVADCEEICDAAAAAGVILTVGFNRRFSQYSVLARQAITGMQGPKMMLYRCNAGMLPPGHWSMDPVIGGGRVVGEGVHFFDYCCWMLDQEPVDIRADRIDSGTRTVNAPDNITSILRFPDGSTATIVYCCVGHPALGKESIEIHGGGKSVAIDDFRGIRFVGLPGKDIKRSAEHKGQFELLQNWIQAIRGDATLSVTAAHGLRATRIAQIVLRSCNSQEILETANP